MMVEPLLPPQREPCCGALYHRPDDMAPCVIFGCQNVPTCEAVATRLRVQGFHATVRYANYPGSTVRVPREEYRAAAENEAAWGFAHV